MLPSMLDASFHSLPPQSLPELAKILRHHDPNAKRLCGFVPHVKLFRYSTNDLHWENNSLIDGSLLTYEKLQVISNRQCSSYAFAIINNDQNLIQPIDSTMLQQADKLRLFYQVVHNEKPEVFCLFFTQETECLRIHTFIQQSMQSVREQQVPIIEPMQNNRPTAHIHRQRTPLMIRDSNTSQVKLSHASTNQTPISSTYHMSTHNHNANTVQSIKSQTPNLFGSIASSPSPILSVNSPEDPSFSLKRLLKIPSQNMFDDEPMISFQNDSINLLPPSAFEPSAGTHFSLMDADRSTQQFSQIDAAVTREHFRQTLLNLIQNDDQFLDIIYHGCATHWPIQQ